MVVVPPERNCPAPRRLEPIRHGWTAIEDIAVPLGHHRRFTLRRVSVPAASVNSPGSTANRLILA